MKISTRGLDELIKAFEGYHKRLPDGRCTTYRCPAGVLTLGYGCTVGLTEGMVWTEQEATDALAREMETHEKAVEKLVKVPVSQEQFDALVSLSYNVGSGAVGKSTLIKHLNAGDPARAASHFADFKYAKVNGKSTVLPGLVRRRAAEAAMFLEGTDQAMPQKVEPAKTKMTISDALLKVGAPVAFGVEVAKQGVPAVPEVVTKSVEHVGAWKGIGKTVWSLGSELAIVPWWAVVGGLAGLGVLAFLKLRERNG